MSDDNRILRSALWYRKHLGWSVIPQRPNKEPLVVWKPFQTRVPTEDEIKEWWTNWPTANAALVTGKVSGVTVIDIDGKQGIDIMEDILPEGFVGPCSKSPRGGKHLFFKYNPKLVSRSRDLPDIDCKNDGGLVTLPPSKRGDKCYEWVAGLSIKDVPLPEIPEGYLTRVVKDKTVQYPSVDIGDFSVELSEGHRDESLFHIALSLIRGGMAPGNAEKVLMTLASSCHPPFPKREAIIKVRSAVERAFKKDRVISQEIRNWVDLTSGIFSVTDIYQALHLVTPEDKANARQVLVRLKEAGQIEPYGKRADVYRRINPELLVMDFKNASGTPIDMWLPWNLHKYVYTYAKNVYVFSGEKDAGKTGVLLNIVRHNMDKFPVHYFSCELSPEELGVRLSKFPDISVRDWNFTAYERASDFGDVIQPDGLNIIDWIEVNKDFSLIGDDIKAIHEKLNKGVAIVAIGKADNSQYGRGRDFARQRARLYVTMSRIGKRNVAKILTAKNRKGEVDPVGMSLIYQLREGNEIVVNRDWQHEEDDDDYTNNGKFFKD